MEENNRSPAGEETAGEDTRKDVEAVAEKALVAINGMLECKAITPSNIRNITGALRDIRELRGGNEGTTLVIRMEGDDEWAR